MIRITASFPAAPSQRSPSLGGRQAELSQSQVRDLGCIILSTVIRRLTEILTITSKAPSCPNAQRSTREDFQHGRLLDSLVVLFRPEAEGRGRFYTPFCPGLGGPVTSDVPFAGPCHWPLFSFARPLLSLSNHFRCVFLPSTVPVHSVFLLSTPPVQPHLSHRSTNTSCFVPRRASSLFPRVDLSRA